jgi:hypothetical protein
MTAAQATLIALGVLAQVVTFTLGVLVGLAKRKGVRDDISSQGSQGGAAYWHSPQVQRR